MFGKSVEVIWFPDRRQTKGSRQQDMVFGLAKPFDRPFLLPIWRPAFCASMGMICVGWPNQKNSPPRKAIGDLGGRFFLRNFPGGT